MDQQNKKTSSSKVKSPVKRKSQFTNRSSRENDKRKKFMRNNFGDDEKEHLKKDGKKRKREMRDNLEEEKKNIKKKRITKEEKQNVINWMILKKNS